MTDSGPLAERLRRAFGPNPRGAVGVVDELLTVCRDHPVQLEWRSGVCCVHSHGATAQEPIELPLPKSVFRAILARFAALCNERAPDSVSPYSGNGELLIGDDTPALFRVAFTNTPDEQRAEVRFVGEQVANPVGPSKPIGAPDAPRVSSPGSA
jgi:hypothetical protein